MFLKQSYDHLLPLKFFSVVSHYLSEMSKFLWLIRAFQIYSQVSFCLYLVLMMQTQEDSGINLKVKIGFPLRQEFQRAFAFLPFRDSVLRFLLLGMYNKAACIF